MRGEFEHICKRKSRGSVSNRIISRGKPDRRKSEIKAARKGNEGLEQRHGGN
jgi:hypothetical protein